MSAEENQADTSQQIETLRQQLERLEKRVKELEATLQHEHEDIERLKEVTDEDHRRLEDLKIPPAGGSTPVVGL